MSRATSGPKQHRCLRYGVLTVAAIGLGLVGVYQGFARQLPDVTPLVAAAASDRYDRPDGILPNPPVPDEAIPTVLYEAVIAIEDRRFYDHGGLDGVGILRAIVNNVRERDFVEGGSSITQQLAKNLYLTHERTWQRKVAEIILARRIEQHLEKQEILAYYLNRVYFGSQAYGVGAASRIYFDKPTERLTLAEAALLAGLLQAPSFYSPHVNPDIARDRRNLVLQVMAAEGSISSDEATAALALPLRITPLR